MEIILNILPFFLVILQKPQDLTGQNRTFLEENPLFCQANTHLVNLLRFCTILFF